MLENIDLIEEELRVFDVFLCDFFDCPPLPSLFLLGFIDYAIGSFAEFLGLKKGLLLG